MNHLSPEELGWIAGVMDAKGKYYLLRSGENYFSRIIVNRTGRGEEILSILYSLTKIGKVKPIYRNKILTSEWSLNAQEQRIFLPIIKKHCKAQLDRIELMLEYFSLTFNPQFLPVSEDIKQRRSSIFERMKL